MMVKRFNSRDGATEEGDGRHRDRPDLARAYLRMGRNLQPQSQPGPGEYGSGDCVTMRMRQAAEKHRSNPQEPGKIQILPDFLSCHPQRPGPSSLSALTERRGDESPARTTRQTMWNGTHCLLD